MAKSREKISDFEISVCEEYLANGLKKTEAYKAVSPKTLTPQSLRTTSWRLFARPQVREYLEERLRPIILSTNQTLAGISELAENAELDRDRLKAYELIGKFYKIFTDRTEITVDVTDLTDAELEALAKSNR